MDFFSGLFGGHYHEIFLFTVVFVKGALPSRQAVACCFIQKAAMSPLGDHQPHLTPTSIFRGWCTSCQKHRDQQIIVSLPALLFYGSSWRFGIEKWQLFLENFSGSHLPEHKTRKVLKNLGKFRSIIQCNIRNENSKNLGNFRSATLLTSSVGSAPMDPDPVTLI